MNKAILIGNLTRDPESSTTQSGITMTRFSIAVNRTYANANGERETDFFNIITWRGLADNCARYLTKGRKVAVTGSIQNRTYDDKEGNKRYVTEIVADDVEFISSGSAEGGAGGGASQSAPRPAKKQVSELEPVENEDLPF